MRYRMEVSGDFEFSIRNVETDRKAGFAAMGLGTHPDYPGRLIRMANVYNCYGEHIAAINDLTVPSPLSVASVAVANHEAHRGYLSLQEGAAGPPAPLRIEHLLGTVLADIAREFARAFIERSRGGATQATKEACGALVADLYTIWSASRFGSFDAKSRVTDGYFAGAPSCAPRMSFGDAALHYGTAELRKRYPNLSDTVLGAVLSWPLKLLTDVVEDLVAARPPLMRSTRLTDQG